ncbi:MAG: ABC transporter ATP-binding protein [Candidatus Heimdallarchaeota archaeon]|nr:MAG: ABC transporter ATP-binding protein [Candidatus Heimdallarchaeota archaeon]
MPEVLIQNLSKNFGHVRALSNVDVYIRDNEYIGIVGPSGCGKTTLINCITGIVEPTSGTIIIDGKDVSGAEIPIEEREFSMVFQNIALFPHLTVARNVEYPGYVKDLSEEETNEKSEKALKLVDLLAEKELYPRQLSGGAQQKAAVARALATQAKLIILDEPISALDLKVRVELRYEILRLVKELGLTAIHITHDQEEVMAISDRVVLMRAGEIIEVSEPKDLYMRPKTLFSLHFVGECNFLEGYIKEISKKRFTLHFRNNVEYLTTIEDKAISNATLSLGDPIVFAIRPENTIINKLKNSNSQTGIRGKVEDIRFLGSYYRYSIKLETEEIVYADQITETTIKVSEDVIVNFISQYVLLFPAPPTGLMEELSLE